MILLAVDTTGERLCVALDRGDGRPPLQRISRPGRPHDERLFSEVERLLRSARVRREALGGIAAASGPGRFTGIRVGLTFASMLGAALGVPVAAVSRLEALAHRAAAAGGRGRVRVVLDGHRGESFDQEFTLARGAARAASAPRWSARALVPTSGPKVLRGETDARDLLAPARLKLAGRTAPPAPLYLRPAHYER